MKGLIRIVLRFVVREHGATSIEYAFIASLIAMAIVGVLITLGPTLSAAFGKVQSSFPG